jgi:hypothetical protein
MLNSTIILRVNVKVEAVGNMDCSLVMEHNRSFEKNIYVEDVCRRVISDIYTQYLELSL